MQNPSSAQLVCDAILFDLDGVLVDSTKFIERTWRTWAARVGLDPADVIEKAHGRRAIETIRHVAPLLNAIDEAAVLAAHESTAVEGISEVPGASALLHTLPADRWAIVTSAIRAVAEHRLSLAHLPTPVVMVCADEVARGKPDAEGYLSAAKQLGRAPADCIVIEDAPAGIDAALSANMRAIALTTTHSQQELSNATFIVPRLADLDVQLHSHEGTIRLHIGVSRELRS